MNRVDVDFSLPRALRSAEIYKLLKIKVTVFVRLHAKEYNSFDFENFSIVKLIAEAGHEICYILVVESKFEPATSAK